jgi:hypothetical protein
MKRSNYPVVSVRLSPELLAALDKRAAVTFGHGYDPRFRGARTMAIVEAVRDWLKKNDPR